MFAPRAGGVVASTASGTGETGPEKSVESIVLLEHYLVKFFDGAGAAHVDVLLRVGDNYYASPFGEEWCAKLGPVQKWLRDTVHKRIQSKRQNADASYIPATDSVNVIGAKATAERHTK